MDSEKHKGIADAKASQADHYVGAGLGIQPASGDLNGNRNFRGRFNIDLSLLAKDLKAQGRSDRHLIA